MMRFTFLALLCLFSYATMISAAPAYSYGRRRSSRTTITLAKPTPSTKTTSRKKTAVPTTTTTAAAVPVPHATPTSGGGGGGGGGGTYSGDGTYYDVGLGSCGSTDSNSDYVAALNAPQMANGANPNKNPQCGKRIKVVNPANQKSVTVTIVDTCPPCAFGSVDLSPSAFDEIADLSLGRIPIEWSYV